jgi:hypothetical protein
MLAVRTGSGDMNRMRTFSFPRRFNVQPSVQSLLSSLQSNQSINLGTVVVNDPLSIANLSNVTIRGKISAQSPQSNWVAIDSNDAMWSRIPSEMRGYVWKTRIKAPVSSFGSWANVQHTGLQKIPFSGVLPLELIYNGVKLELPRTPGFATAGTSVVAQNIVEYTDNEYNFSDLSNVSGMFLIGNIAVNYAVELKSVSSINTETKRFTLESNHSTTSSLAGAKFFGVNLPEFFSGGGQYWIDYTTGSNYGFIYLIAPGFANPNLNEVMITTNNAANTSLFSATNCANLVLTDFVVGASAQTALNLTDCSNLVLDTAEIRNITNAGVRITNCSNATIDNVTIERIGAQGLSLNNGTRAGRISSNTSLNDVTIGNSGTLAQTSGYPLRLQGIGFAIANSKFENSEGCIFSEANDAAFVNCTFDNLAKNSVDAGFFYTGRNPTYRGITFTGCQFKNVDNLVYPIVADRTGGRFKAAIYADDGVCEVIADDCIFEGDDLAFRVNGGSHNAITNSSLTGFRIGMEIDNSLQTWAADRTAIPNQSDYAISITTTANVTAGATTMSVQAIPSTVNGNNFAMRAGDKIWFDSLSRFVTLANHPVNGETYPVGATTLTIVAHTGATINSGSVGIREGTWLFYSSLLAVDAFNPPYSTAYPNLAEYYGEDYQDYTIPRENEFSGNTTVGVTEDTLAPIGVIIRTY